MTHVINNRISIYFAKVKFYYFVSIFCVLYFAFTFSLCTVNINALILNCFLLDCKQFKPLDEMSKKFNLDEMLIFSALGFQNFLMSVLFLQRS